MALSKYNMYLKLYRGNNQKRPGGAS